MNEHKIIAGLRDAIAYARGDLSRARVTVINVPLAVREMEETKSFRASDGSLHSTVSAARERDFRLKLWEFFGWEERSATSIGDILQNPEELYRILHEHLRKS